MYNDFQLGLIEKAYERIMEEDERFICCALTTVAQMPDDIDYFDRIRYADKMKDDINLAIRENICLELWLFQELGIYPDDIGPSTRASWDRAKNVGWLRAMPRDEYKNLCRVCRMTWMERALETGSFV